MKFIFSPVLIDGPAFLTSGTFVANPIPLLFIVPDPRAFVFGRVPVEVAVFGWDFVPVRTTEAVVTACVAPATDVTVLVVTFGPLLVENADGGRS